MTQPSEFTDCPACGKPRSAWPGKFCGACERKYHDEQAQLAEQEERELEQAMEACGCGEELCTQCTYRYARILELTGKPDQAAAFINQ